MFPDSPRSEEATLAKRHNDEFSATLRFVHCHIPRLTHQERSHMTFPRPSLRRLCHSCPGSSCPSTIRVISRDSPDSGRPTPP